MAKTIIDDSEPEKGIIVTPPGGGQFSVMNQQEKDYYESIAKKYQEDNLFTNISDLQELARILTMELLCFRWSHWLINERDYDGAPVNLKDLQDSIKKYSQEVRLLKETLGIDKASREKGHGDTVQEYIHNLGVRAKKFGIMRNEQAYKAIDLWRELSALVTKHMNSIPEEQVEFNCRQSDVIEWIINKAVEFDMIDYEFRTKEQAIWIQDQ